MTRRIPVPTATRAPDGTTNAYVVDGPEPLLVDPAAETPELDEAVAAVGVDHIAVTHTHPDHVGAVATYADRYDATVWALAGRGSAFEQATGRYPDATFRDGTALPMGATVRYLPGHAVDHVGFGLGDAILIGDLAFAEGSVVVGRGGDMRAYLTSLRRLHAMHPAVLHPGHGPAITDPRATLKRLIDHRLRREQRILAAVEAGATTVDEILDAAYDKPLDGVRDLAAETVEAHLAKLAVEGHVEW